MMRDEVLGVLDVQQDSVNGLTEADQTLLLNLCGQAEQALLAFGDPIPADILNALNTGGEGAVFTRDVPAAMFIRTARYFMKLLQGDLSSEEIDARFEPHMDV